MVRPLPLPPDGTISNRRLAQIRRRHREKILKQAQRQTDRQDAEQRRLDKLSSTNKIEKPIENSETIELETEGKAETVKEDNPNSPRRILRDLQMQRRAKRKKSVQINNGEFYPDKLKRKIVYKKITLEPHQELVPLGCINKRKRNNPKKGEDYQQALKTGMSNEIKPKLKRKVRNVIREESVEEIIMRIEETDSLTDEDLMEILTCPSPVWWEEPLNPFYFDEEPINKKLQKPNRKRPHQASIKQNKTVNHIDKIEINLENRDEKFVSKRSTLEKILSNIKDNIEPAKNLHRKLFNKKPWKYLDERNPAFGLKRNSKGRFLKKKIGSSPITISDVSDREENSRNRTRITTKSTKLDIAIPNNDITTKTTNLGITTANTVVITKVSHAETIDTDIGSSKSADTTKIPKNNDIVFTCHKKDSSKTESNTLPYNNITKDEVELTNTIDYISIDTTNSDKQIILKENKNTRPYNNIAKDVIELTNTKDESIEIDTKNTDKQINLKENENFRHYNNITKDVIQLTDTKDESIEIDTKNTDTQINLKENNNTKETIDLKNKNTNKDFDSPKALIWTSNTGDRKVITFTQDSEMSSDVEIVTEDVDLDIPTELPPLKWYPKTDTIENTKNDIEISNVNTSSDVSIELSDDKNDDSYANNSFKVSNTQVQHNNIEPNSDIYKEILNNPGKSQEENIDRDFDIDMISSKNDDENDEKYTKNDTNYIIEGSSDDMAENDIDNKNDTDIGDSSNDMADNDIDDSEDTYITADPNNYGAVTKTTETIQNNDPSGVFERSKDYFENKGNDDVIEKDKNRDEYVVVYQIDE